MVNQLQNELREKVRKGMKEREWSQETLAHHAGVTQTTVSNLLSTNRTGTLKTWNALLRALED